MSLVEIKCKVCEKPMQIQAWLVENGGRKHCSRTCSAVTQRGRPSSVKGKHWTVSEDGRRNMSVAAKARGSKPPIMTGDKNPRWKGGISPKSRLERVKFRQQLQSKILHRDNYTCQICDEYGGNLQIDHIKEWADYPELRFEESNCRTLCMACHYYITFKRKMPKGIVWGHNLGRRTIKS